MYCSYNKGHVPIRLPHTLSHSEERLSHCSQQELEKSSGLQEAIKCPETYCEECTKQQKNGKGMERNVGFFQTFYFVRNINGELSQVRAVHDVYSMAKSGLPCSRNISTKHNVHMMEYFILLHSLKWQHFKSYENPLCALLLQARLFYTD